MKWTTEITNKGAELIAQAVASGDMVFTKAVGSSTLSGAADLKTVTEVSQPQYELKLKSIEAAGNSTRLTVRLLNDGVDEAYTIRQVGIYGKLKDDTEETLISISENSVGETVPSTTTIPEWVCDLAIVLNMDNTIKPTINIPSGVYANAVHEHSTSDITDLPEISGKNLLDNPDFKINQRGLTEYSASQYTVDRWRISTNGSVTVNDDGSLTITSLNDTNTYFVQTIKCNAIYGHNVTMTLCDSDDLILSASGIVPIETPSSHYCVISIHHNSGVTFDLWRRADDEVIAQFAIPAGSSFRTNWVKLELGPVATPFIAPNETEELIKIQNMNDDGSSKLSKDVRILNNNMVVGKNLLDNPDFKINQRGKSEYVLTSESYCFDRWRVQTISSEGEGTITITQLDSEIRIENTGTNDGIKQFLPSDTVKRGLTYCMSATINNVRHHAVFNTDIMNDTYVVQYDDTPYYAALRLDDLNSLCIAYPYITYAAGESVVLCDVKLELGAVATPFIAPNPVEELLKIQSMNDDGSPKLISNDLLPTVVNSQMISNPNLLDNPDFKINQRGLSEYTTSSGYTYTVDRWYASSSLCKVNLQGNGIAITMVQSASVNSHELWQIFETPLEPGSYSMSLKVESVTGIWSARFRTVNSAGEFASSYYTPTLKNGVNNLSVDIPDGEYISSISVGFDKSNEVDSSIVINWIKVESGPVATPFVPPNPATELAKCQRYLLKLNGDLQTGMLYGTNSIWFLIPGFNMRTTPSIEKNNLGIKVTHGSDGTIITDGLSWSVDVAKESGVVLRMTKTNHGYTDTTLHGGTGDNFTLLSADM